jgi:release factor glutamine methyltransferase
MTVLELINLTTGYFEKKEIESPRFNAEMLLASVMKCRRLDLYLRFDQPLPEIEVAEYRELIKQRALRTPLQYLLGEVEFHNLRLKVNPSVLIPRPETELLIDEAIKINNLRSAIQPNGIQYDAVAEPESPVYDSLRILDIGTGSGNIAIALAKHLTCSVTAIDIDENALATARENARMNELDGRIQFRQIDILADMIDDMGKFDLIVSNPPYVDKDEYKNLQAEIKDHEPRFAVTDDDDGLRFYRRIAELLPNLLANGGALLVEIGFGQAASVVDIFSNAGLTDIAVIKDYLNIERVVKGKRK